MEWPPSSIIEPKPLTSDLKAQVYNSLPGSEQPPQHRRRAQGGVEPKRGCIRRSNHEEV